MISGATAGRTPTRKRMAGRVRPVEVPLLRGLPDPADYQEHVTADGRRVFVAKRVVLDLAELERSEHPDETAGLLFGGYFTDGDRTCTVVTKLVKPRPGEVHGTRSSVTITPGGAEQMIARGWQEDPVLAPVGWGHTHPCFEAYFSGVDRTEQQAWRDAGSVGLVISGLAEPRPRYRVFVGPESASAEPVRRVVLASEMPMAPRKRELLIRDTRRPLGARWRRAHLSSVVGHRLVAFVLAIGVVVALAISVYAARTAVDARRQAREAHHLAVELQRSAEPKGGFGIGEGRLFPNRLRGELEVKAAQPVVEEGGLRP
jgi:proteasome lid subunit RPN8/RPN11